MGVNHRARTGKKTTGGRYKTLRGKRNFEKGSLPVGTTNGAETKIKAVRTHGAGSKVRVLRVAAVNLYDPKSKTFAQAKVNSVSANPANRHFVRQNTITKGAIIETEKGKAKVTSRPGQDGTVNANLI